MTNSKRRWLRFSLRAMFALLTVLAVWIGMHASTVHARKTFREQAMSRGARFTPKPTYTWRDFRAIGFRPASDPPWIRRLMGDQTYIKIVVDATYPDDEYELLSDTFPEAQVWRGGDKFNGVQPGMW